MIFEPLENNSKIPSKAVIIARYYGLASNVKDKSKRIQLLVAEVQKLWGKFSFPIQSVRTVHRKISTILKQHEKHLKRPSNVNFDEVIDFTHVKGTWLCREDKLFYEQQVKSKGRVGYCTGQVAEKETVHPSKRIKGNHGDKEEAATQMESTGSEEDTELEEETWSNSGESDHCGKRKYGKTTVAVKMVKECNLSFNSASRVSRLLKKEGFHVPNPSRSGVGKAVYREADLMIQQMRMKLKERDWCLHFDGKNVNKRERQVVLLSSPETVIHLKVLTLNDGTSNTIAKGILQVLQEYDLLQSECIKMIVSDTCNGNTGRKNGVVVQLQRHFIHPVQYVGCQHHVLDLILKHVIEQFFAENARSPNIEYYFVMEVTKNYEDMKKKFMEEEHPMVDFGKTDVWRDDMKFLFNLIHAFKYWEDNSIVPQLSLPKLPNISKARWNSKAIYALLAFLLHPKCREDTRLLNCCRFISGVWSSIWFSNQVYDKSNFSNLRASLVDYKKACLCLETRWVKEDSAIPGIRRTNMCAERAIKVMTDLLLTCKTELTLNQMFVLDNKL